MISRLNSIACKRALGSFLLALLLVLTFAPVFASTAIGCTMKCNRNKNSCCCRKTATPYTVSARTCPAGCCQPNTIPAFAFAAIIPLSPATALPASTASLATPLLPALFALLCFALFQRPPPPIHLSRR
jgi:hypothetical protein